MQLLVYLGAFFPSLLVEILSIFCNVLFFHYCFILSWYPFRCPSSTSILSFIISGCSVWFTCVAFLFSSHRVFHCLINFLIISYLCFQSNFPFRFFFFFLLVFFKGTQMPLLLWCCLLRYLFIISVVAFIHSVLVFYRWLYCLFSDIL